MRTVDAAVQMVSLGGNLAPEKADSEPLDIQSLVSSGLIILGDGDCASKITAASSENRLVDMWKIPDASSGRWDHFF